MGNLRSMCIPVSLDAGDEPDKVRNTSWCGRDMSQDKYKLPSAEAAVQMVWTMNGVSICKVCGEHVIKLLADNLEERPA